MLVDKDARPDRLPRGKRAIGARRNNVSHTSLERTMALPHALAVKKLGATETRPRSRSVGLVDLLTGVRAACLRLPEVTERLSHGAPSFFVRGRTTFVMLMADGHHDIAFPHLWCAAPPGAQAELIATDPQRFFRPPYVGHRGWLGVRLDGPIDGAEIGELCEDAYRTVAPKRLINGLDNSD